MIPQTASLTLPEDKTIRISVVAGPSKGLEYHLSRPLVTVGRLKGGADIELNDPEVSGVHCTVEVRRDAILLHDLRSTNGTYIGDSRVFAARLETGGTTGPGKYPLNDRTQERLLDALCKQNLAGVLPETRAELLEFFGDPDAPYAAKSKSKEWDRIQTELKQLKGTSDTTAQTFSQP
jgi:pSer/pThr/pTyr-binding forkhead associated (FHA) protein